MKINENHGNEKTELKLQKKYTLSERLIDRFSVWSVERWILSRIP